MWAEYVVIRLVVGLIRHLPRFAARNLGAVVGMVMMRLGTRLRNVALTNLQLAFPHLSSKDIRKIAVDEYRHLGWLLAEFCKMPLYTVNSASRFIRYEGLDHYLNARDKDQGVLILTGHLGAWELSSFFHSLMGYPMGLLIRRLDNPLIDRFVNRVRCLHGNRVIHKDDFARGLLASMRAGETVGILMDTNMTPPQGVFVPFFDRLACTASGLARVAQKTGAAVLPGFLLWQVSERKYVLHFGEELTLHRTGDLEADTLANTAMFTAVLEEYIRRYPDQWLWMHRRWKTRPPGEEKMYS